MKRKKLFVSIATFALSIALMLFGVYAAASPSVKLSGQISYEVYDAKVLARGRIENAKTFDGSADVNAATYPAVNADYKTSTKINTQSQYLDYTIGDEKGDSTDNFETWTFGDIAFNETNVNPVKMYVELTNYSLYDIVATITFDTTEQDLRNNNLKRTVSKRQVVIAGFNQTATSQEILIEYDVINRGAKVNKFNVNANITIEQYYLPINPDNATLEGWNYVNNEDKTITLTAYTGSETDIVIPAALDGKTVTSIKGDAANQIPLFHNCTEVTSVTLPESLQSIGEAAFGYCTSLTEITLPASLETIGYGAFFQSGIQSIDIPEGVTSIGDGAFSGCAQLTDITLPSTLKEIGAQTFAESGITSIEIPEGVTIIDEGAFQKCASLTEATLPASLETIGDYAFNFSGLTSIEIPEGVTKIGYRAFGSCVALTEVTLPSTIKEMGWAFHESGLTNIEIPEGVTIIGEDAFIYMSSLKEVTLPSTLKEIGESAFNNSGLISVEIPEGVTKIGEYAFSNCESLTEVTLPSTLKEIGQAAFASCELLTEVTLPSTLKEIGVSAFFNTGLTSIEIPEGVTKIGANAFQKCASLTEATLPSTLKEIGNGAFSESGLKSIEIPASVTFIDSYAFEDCKSLIEVTVLSINPPTLGTIDSYWVFSGSDLLIVYVPDESVSAYQGADGWDTETIKGLSEKTPA